MMPFEDVQFQLIDLPPVSADHPVPWLANTLQTADAALLVVDLADPSCLDQLQSVQSVLAQQRVTLSEQWSAGDSAHANAPAPDNDPFALRLPSLLLANKVDGIADVEAELQVLRDLSEARWPMQAVSATTGHGLGDIAPWLFNHLGIVRIYTKLPGHEADKLRPFTLRRGQTVGDVAKHVHGDVARSLRYARVWGHSAFEGQHVGPEHIVDDGDVVELHA